MAFDIGIGGYLAYAIGYAIAAAFLIAHRRELSGKMSAVRLPREEHRNAAEAA